MKEVDRNLEKVDLAIDDFGKVVQDFRLKNGLTLQDMADLVSCSPSYLWRIENQRRNPDMDVKVRILMLGMCWDPKDVLLFLERSLSKDALLNQSDH
ncbi:helix-turn-helix domain-containing protein [Evansella tamaricis]|uniref:Helix-turn-helix domain-containing protein n=1 Tax=Evansella tamaricis TaxID=2069301 RepID=A0ABS6JEX6_9BACI|nr:helix-turn-helix transcriptional regulator [Evansella tamaricis]MBU9710888.1 helix-turn-helix domain-containing protein [Evansella tamaricis]